MKQCVICEVAKPFSDFYKTKRGVRENPDTASIYTYPYCKPCAKDKNRDNDLKRIYGLSAGQYNRMFEQQGGCCGICSTHQSRRNRALAVDNCHKTGKIRGLLCHLCNNGIGVFKDNPSTLRRAADYLDHYERIKS